MKSVIAALALSIVMFCYVVNVEVVKVLSEEVLGVMKLRELVIGDGVMMSLSSSCLNSLYFCTVGAHAERRN